MAALHWMTHKPAWLDPAVPIGRLSLQSSLNGMMLTTLITLQGIPWLAFAVMAILFGLTVALHGRAVLVPLALFGGLGWVGEAWLIGLGGVWHFAHPTLNGIDGGLFGAPFYMALGWGLVGALMLDLAAVFAPRAA